MLRRFSFLEGFPGVAKNRDARPGLAIQFVVCAMAYGTFLLQANHNGRLLVILSTLVVNELQKSAEESEKEPSITASKRIYQGSDTVTMPHGHVVPAFIQALNVKYADEHVLMKTC